MERIQEQRVQTAQKTVETLALRGVPVIMQFEFRAVQGVDPVLPQSA